MLIALVTETGAYSESYSIMNVLRDCRTRVLVFIQTLISLNYSIYFIFAISFLYIYNFFSNGDVC